MRARFAESFSNDVRLLQVIVEAESNDERLLMAEFLIKAKKHGLHLHGYGGSGSVQGYEHFNFGPVAAGGDK